MKTTLTVLSLILFFNSYSQTILVTSKDSLSYAIGITIGNDLKKQGLDTFINADVLFRAMREGLLPSGMAALSQEESGNIITDYMNAIRTKQFEMNKKESEMFMADNSKKEKVVTLPSGLQYEVVNKGDGPKPTLMSKVKVHYTGKFVNGNVFDSSLNSDPAEFMVSQVIPGWQEGICLMNTGSKYILYIPWDLAYGEQGISGTIPPYSTLVFDVELIEIIE